MNNDVIQCFDTPNINWKCTRFVTPAKARKANKKNEIINERKLIEIVMVMPESVMKGTQHVKGKTTNSF